MTSENITNPIFEVEKSHLCLGDKGCLSREGEGKGWTSSYKNCKTSFVNQPLKTIKILINLIKNLFSFSQLTTVRKILLILFSIVILGFVITLINAVVLET
jgi:hypothetical protein